MFEGQRSTAFQCQGCGCSTSAAAVCPEVHPGLTWGHHHPEPTHKAKVKIGANLGAWSCDHKITSPSPLTQVKSADQAPASWPLPPQQHPQGWGTADRLGTALPTQVPTPGPLPITTGPAGHPGFQGGRPLLPNLGARDRQRETPSAGAGRPEGPRPHPATPQLILWVPTPCGPLHMEPEPHLVPVQHLGLAPPKTQQPSG